MRMVPSDVGQYYGKWGKAALFTAFQSFYSTGQEDLSPSSCVLPICRTQVDTAYQNMYCSLFVAPTVVLNICCSIKTRSPLKRVQLQLYV